MKENEVRITIRVPVEVHERLRKISYEDRISINQIVLNAILYGDEKEIGK